MGRIPSSRIPEKGEQLSGETTQTQALVRSVIKCTDAALLSLALDMREDPGSPRVASYQVLFAVQPALGLHGVILFMIRFLLTCSSSLQLPGSFPTKLVCLLPQGGGHTKSHWDCL